MYSLIIVFEEVRFVDVIILIRITSHATCELIIRDLLGWYDNAMFDKMTLREILHHDQNSRCRLYPQQSFLIDGSSKYGLPHQYGNKAGYFCCVYRMQVQ